MNALAIERPHEALDHAEFVGSLNTTTRGWRITDGPRAFYNVKLSAPRSCRCETVITVYWRDAETRRELGERFNGYGATMREAQDAAAADFETWRVGMNRIGA